MVNKNTSKFLSLILRHQPELIDIKLDKNGWADVDELIEKINDSGHNLDLELLKELVETNDKKRFSFNSDITKIRANQGHSINVDVQLKKTVPPVKLYHGTAKKFLDSISETGLDKRNRLHVHLTEDKTLAEKQGARWKDKTIILSIDCKQMLEDGFDFYKSENNVWLVDSVPSKYILI